MATAGPSEYRSVTDQTRLAQNSHSADSASQPSPLQMSLRRPSTCQSPTAIPKPSLEKPSSRRSYSRTSSVSSLKSSSGPSGSCSPDSSPVSSVREVSITDAEVKEPEQDLPKAPEHFTRAFSIPKTLFDIYETSREWHFGFTPMQNVHALEMELNEANLKREKAEQQVRDLTQRLSSVAEPGPKIQSSESERKCSEGANVTPSKLRKERDARLIELIEKKGKIPLKKRFEELVGWCQKIEADIDAAQDRNMLLFDELGEASKDITRLKNERLSLETNKEKLEKQLEQSRKQTTVANDDQTSAVPIAKPPQSLAPQNDQENRLGELQRENERLRLENDVMRNGLEQLQSQDSPPEEPETQLNDATPEVAQAWSADPGVEVQGADANIGGITAGQDSVGPQDIEVTVIPVTPPAASEAREILRFNLQRFLSSVNRDSILSSDDDARRRRDIRRHERQRRREQRRLEREEEARQQQRERTERKKDAQRPLKHHGQSSKVYKKKKKILSPLGWVRYRRTLMDFLSFSYMFSSPLKLS